MLMAKTFAKGKNWLNAAKAFQAALKQFPNDARAMIGLGNVYRELNQFHNAIRVFQRVLRHDSTNYMALMKIGEILVFLERLPEATKTFMRAGNLCAKNGNLDNALKIWRKVLEVDSNHIQVYNNIIHAYVRQGDTEEAISALIELAIIFEKKGDKNRVKQQLQGAKHLAPDNPRVKAAFNAAGYGISIEESQKDVNHLNSLESEIHSTELFKGSLWGDDDNSEHVANPLETALQTAREELVDVMLDDNDGRYGHTSLNMFEIGALITQAFDMEAKKRHDEATTLLQYIVDSGYKRPAVMLVLANSYLKQNRHDEARHYLKLCRKDKRYAEGVNFAFLEAV